MTINFHQLVLLALLGTAIHWIVARSTIMKWFWDLRWWPSKRCPECNNRYVKVESSIIPGRRILQHTCTRNAQYPQPPIGIPLIRDQLQDLFAGLLACAACSGWWLCLFLGSIGLRPLDIGPWWLDMFGSGLAGTVTVPILEGVLLWGLERTHID